MHTREEVMPFALYDESLCRARLTSFGPIRQLSDGPRPLPSPENRLRFQEAVVRLYAGTEGHCGLLLLHHWWELHQLVEIGQSRPEIMPL